jgi:beta-lactamase class A
MRRRRPTKMNLAPALVLTVFLPLLALGASPASATSAKEAPARTTGVPDPRLARELVASIVPDAGLQKVLDAAVADIGRRDPKFLASSPRIAAIDLGPGHAPRLAHVRGDLAVYPASVVKFVYLMAAYAFQEQGRLTIDADLDAELSHSIRESSNTATQKVFARLTGTTQGAELPAAEYTEFRRRRLLVKDWLVSLGIDDLHTVNPTWNGGGDLFGRDQHFLRDRSVAGGLPVRGEQYSNRNAMTAGGTARLLALLATDRALTAADSETVRRRMKRDVKEQPHLAHRIAGGAAKVPGAEVYAKSGTWGPIYADAGIVRDAHGRQFAIAVFTDAQPPYRGDAIAEITERLSLHLFASAPVREGDPT